MKTCIICRKKKENFNDEHVIPDSIQGYYHINSVCIDCNSRMGDTIDNTLTNHKFIEFQRFLLNIKGKSGAIPNPLRGTHRLRANPERKVTLEVGNEGNFVPKLLPVIYNHPTQQPVIDSFTVSIDKKDENQLKKIIEKVIKRNGLDKNRLTSKRVESEIDSAIAVTLNIDTKDFKIGMLKIAYEFAVDNIPEYFWDEMAITISEILYLGDFTGLEKKVFFFGSGFDHVILTPFEYLLDFQEKSHYLILLSTNHGLVCVINLFNSLSIGIKLSNSTEYLKDNLLVGRNDLNNHSFMIYNAGQLMDQTYTPLSFAFNYAFENNYSRIEFEILSSSGLLAHHKNDGHISLFDKNGNIIYLSILDKLEELPHKKMGDTINEMTTAYQIEEDLYIKLLPTHKLYRITEVYATRFRKSKL